MPGQTAQFSGRASHLARPSRPSKQFCKHGKIGGEVSPVGAHMPAGQGAPWTPPSCHLSRAGSPAGATAPPLAASCLSQARDPPTRPPSHPKPRPPNPTPHTLDLMSLWMMPEACKKCTPRTMSSMTSLPQRYHRNSPPRSPDSAARRSPPCAACAARGQGWLSGPAARQLGVVRVPLASTYYMLLAGGPGFGTGWHSSAHSQPPLAPQLPRPWPSLGPTCPPPNPPPHPYTHPRTHPPTSMYSDTSSMSSPRTAAP